MPGCLAAFAARSVALGVAVLALAAPARAQAPRKPPEQTAPELRITWQGPEDCERGDAVRAKVLRLLGSRRALTESVEVAVMVRRESASRYVAELSTSTAAGAGSKRLEGESCDAIALASAVVIALSVDPEASLEEAKAEPEPPPPPRPKRRRLAPPPPRRAAPPRFTSPYLHVSVGALFGLLGEPLAFSAAGVGLRVRRFSFELGGAVYQSRDTSLTDRPTVGASFRLFSGDLLGCYAPFASSLGALEGCLGGRLELLSASAFGVSHPDEGEVLLGSGLAVARARLRATSWLSATLDAGAAARTFHPTLVLVGVGDVYEIPVFSAFARIGLVVEF